MSLFGHKSGGCEHVSLCSSFSWYKTDEDHGYELLKLVLSHFNGFNGIGYIAS